MNIFPEPNPLVKCPKCGQTVDIHELLDGTVDYWDAADVIIVKTPCCGSRQELRVATGELLSGRVYAAGGPKFRTATAYNVPIKVRHSRDGLDVEFDDDSKLHIGQE